MRRDHVRTFARSSSMKDADRIRVLLREIWDVRESGDPESSPREPQLWRELEHLVSRGLEHKVAEELTLQD